MTLSEAVKLFEANFASVANRSRVDEDPSMPLICSGGVIKDVHAVYPALYASEELAVEAWEQVAHENLPHASFDTLEWVYKPELLKFQMTMTDRIGQQRVVTDRYTVKSQFRVVKND